MSDPVTSTLTTRVAAVEFKMLHIHFRALKIHEDQEQINSKTYEDNRAKIKGMRNAAYSCIDMLISMEHIVGVINDIFATSELRDKLDENMYVVLNKSKKIAEKWKPVRNRVGGHLDIETVEEFCEENNYKGVFLSDDLEADLGVLNILAIQSALNHARSSTDIFGRDMRLMEEMEEFIKKLNKDWDEAFAYYKPTMEFLYRVGKNEKLAAAHPNDVGGIVTGE